MYSKHCQTTPISKENWKMENILKLVQITKDYV